MAPELVSVEICNPGSVFHLDVLIVQVVVLVEVSQTLVASESHHSQLLFTPCVHRQAAHQRGIETH